MNLEELFLKFSLLGAEWVLWLLVALSLVSVAIMVERTVVFVKLSSRFDELALRLRELLRRNDVDGALRYLEDQRNLEGAVARAGLREADRGAATAEETMVGIRTRERLGLERNLAFLGTVGSNAPFIGLFGTVLGIIKAFDSLAGAESANFKVVMADISEALVATGVGLLVAIPAVVAFNIFNRRVRAIVSNSEAVEHIVLAQLKGEPIAEDGDSAGADTEAAKKKADRDSQAVSKNETGGKDESGRKE
jgi:biopolymer transport protein ExbB